MSATVEPALDLRAQCCSRCGETKPWRDFPVARRWEDGTVRTVRSWCRVCQNKASNDWRRRNWDHDLAVRRARYRKRQLEVQQQRDTFLKAEPLRRFLEMDGRDLWVISELTETGWDTISRLLKGHSRFVKLSNADRIITRLGGRLDDVYPLEDEGARP